MKIDESITQSAREAFLRRTPGFMDRMIHVYSLLKKCKISPLAMTQKLDDEAAQVDFILANLPDIMALATYGYYAFYEAEESKKNG